MVAALTFTPRKPRQRVFKAATTLTDTGNAEITCVVRNMHEEGAELDLPQDADLPEYFLLYLPFERIGRQARVRWREGDRAGIQFIAERPSSV